VETGNASHLAASPNELLLEGQVVTSQDAGLGLLSPKRDRIIPSFDKSIFVDNQGTILGFLFFAHLNHASPVSRTISTKSFSYPVLYCSLTGRGTVLESAFRPLRGRTYIRESCKRVTDDEIERCTLVTDGTPDMRTCIKRVHPSRRRPLPLVDPARSGRSSEVRFLLRRGIVDDSVYDPEDDALHRLFGLEVRLSEFAKRGLRPTALAHAVWEEHVDVVRE
jgi:hypothetical protein